MGLFTVGLRDDDFEPAYNDVPDRRDGGRINPYHDRINAQKSCRRMEKTRPELVELARSDTGTRVSWQYGQWRQWAEWKARNEYGDDEGWDALDGNDALRRLLGTGEDRKASQGHGIPTALMYLATMTRPWSPTLNHMVRRAAQQTEPQRRMASLLRGLRTDPHGPSRRPHMLRNAQGQSPADRHHTA